MAKFIDSSGVEFACPVTFSAPSGSVQSQFVVQRYVSQLITQAALSAGATNTINLTGEPTAIIPIAAYVVTDETTTSSNGATTGLSAEVGISGDPNFLLESTSVFGAAGRKEAYAGVGMGGYRSADAIQLKLTATGAGSEDCAHISNLNLYVVLYYISVATEV